VLLPETGKSSATAAWRAPSSATIGEAADDLGCYLQHHPDADDAAALQRRLAELRAGGPRWH
jgi:hypothetical protein